MKALVTGATGFIGSHVAELLRARGCEVRVLLRRESDFGAFARRGMEPVGGDIRDGEAVARAVKGCSRLFHAAADYRLWVPDPESMYATNVTGTRNVLEAAMKLGVEKVVYTSTVGVLRTGSSRAPANEHDIATLPEMIGHYKRSKYIAEQEALRYAAQGLPIVIVSPSTPIGPMDRKPTPTGRIILDFLNGKMPAYLDTGLNFIDVRDVAEGHWLASELGISGQRYILGNVNSTLRDFLHLVAAASERVPPAFCLPYYPVLCAAYLSEAVSRLTGREPLIPITGVKMSRSYMYFDTSKAVRELHMPRSPIESAVRNAVDWFSEQNYVGRRKGIRA